MLKFKTSCAVLAYLSSNWLNEVGLSRFLYFEVGLCVCDIVVKKFTFAISSPDEFLSIDLQVVDFSHKIFTNCWNNSFQQSTTVSIVFTNIYIIYSLPVMLITFAMTVFNVLWLFQSHAAVVKHYNAFCIKSAANSDTEQNNSSKSTFPVCVSEHFLI